MTALKQKPTMRQIWQTSQGHLKLMFYDPCIWQENIAPLVPASWQNGILTLAAPSHGVRDLCAIRLNRLIQREVSLEAGRPVTINYIVQPPHEETPC